MRRNSQPIVSAPRRGRRQLWARAVIGLVSTAVIATAVSVQADPSGDALARLKSGNARFVADATEALPITAPRRAALAQGQSPFATVLSCADSRVPPEVVFHTGLGDLFVVRSAAHVTDRAVLATLEYGADRLHTPLLVVMGHESCGIVKAALETRETAMRDKIKRRECATAGLFNGHRPTTIDEACDKPCAKAVVDIHYGDIGRTGVQHAE